jgi:hypothetical protein
MSDEVKDPTEFLEHYGVKGMKWGVRRKRSRSSGGSDSNDSQSPQQKAVADQAAKFKRRAAFGLGVAAVGTAATMYHLGKSGNMPAKEIAVDKHLRKAAQLRQSIGSAKAPKPKTKMKFSDSGDLAAMKAKAASAVKEANAMLREQDDKLGIPFPEREYLKEWT